MPAPTSPSNKHFVPHRRRALNCTSLVALTFFCVAGGAFGLEDAVGSAGPFIAIPTILILPWLWSCPTALMTAELSAAMPEDGGYVVWVEKAFGKFWGFLEGWLSWLCSFADNALYPVMFVDYLAYRRGNLISNGFFYCFSKTLGVYCASKGGLNRRFQDSTPVTATRSAADSP